MFLYAPSPFFRLFFAPKFGWRVSHAMARHCNRPDRQLFLAVGYVLARFLFFFLVGQASYHARLGICPQLTRRDKAMSAPAFSFCCWSALYRRGGRGGGPSLAASSCGNALSHNRLRFAPPLRYGWFRYLLAGRYVQPLKRTTCCPHFFVLFFIFSFFVSFLLIWFCALGAVCLLPRRLIFCFAVFGCVFFRVPFCCLPCCILY